MLTVNSIDIQNWAKTIKSRSDLPDLIRRLIYNTIAYKDIEYVAFPCGENIDNPGYDGELIVKESNPFIPLGRSVWEMSTQKNISQKANEDLKKRSEGKDEKKKDTVFIFVTVNIWNRKKGWVAEKSAHGVWKEVRAYDALDIEEWLINSHSAKRWFLEQIGKSAPDLITLESYAKQWISSFELEIPVQISLAGRKSDIEQVHNFLNNTDKTLRIRSITKDEVIIFLYSAIQALPDDQRKNAFLSNAIVAKTSDSLRSQNLDSISELLIIPAFTNIQDINYQSGQKFMIPLDPSTPSKKEDLELSRITIREIENQLVSVGFSDNEAKLWSKNSGGTLTILRRLISGPHLPEWAYKNQNQIRQILPIMFVQSWKTEYSGDKEMISKLAKTEYSDYNSFLTEILHYSDRPIHRIGNMWFTYSVLDCYLSFMSYTTKDDWNLFRDVVIEVLSERNPELDLESQNRVFSAIYGKNRKYSEELRKGLAQSLILLAIYGKHSGNDSLHDHAGYVDQIVENIFLIADKDLWYSLGDVMPLLAEASPTKFIRAVEASLSSKEKYIMNMFDEAQVTLFSKDIHYNLLWALQALAWDKRFFKRVVMALCQLSELEPGKDAFNNLTSIFCLWIPQTETSMDERFDVLADIQKTYPAIGWKLLMTLLPSSNDFGTYTSRYKWRELSCPPRPDISQIQFEESIYKTIELAYSYHDNSALSWVQIFDHYDNLPVSCKRMIAEQFKTKVSELIDPEHIVAEKLRSIISKHRTYKSAKWALPEAEIKYLEDLYKQVEPDSALAKYKYLFADFFPDLLEGRKNYQENPEYINQLRTETLKEIIAEIGFTGIIKFSKKPEYQHILASAIPINLISENIDLILETLDSKNKKEVCFCQYLLGTGEKEFGENWAQKLINKAIKDDWAPNKLIKLMLGFSSKRWIWNLLEKMPAEIQTNYWEKTSVAYHDMDSEDTQYMIQKLCESFRNYSALNLAFHSRHSLSIYTIIQVLKTTATTKCCEDAYGNVSYYIEKLLEVVQKAPDIDLETIITLEFHYIPIITSSHSSVRPKYLHQYMSDNPQAFIDMLYMFYKPKQKDEFQNIEDHNKEIIDEQNKRIAKNAFNVLQTWNVIPGSSPQGDIDAAKLINWIDSVINLASEKDVLVFALNKIGNVLSFSPKGEGNQWPCDSVCEVIEHYKNEKIDQGFQIEVYNQRGLISKEVFEGGIQERQIAASYKNYTSTVRNRYPWVSDILNNIANSYDNEAKSEDFRAEVDKIKYE